MPKAMPLVAKAATLAQMATMPAASASTPADSEAASASTAAAATHPAPAPTVNSSMAPPTTLPTSVRPNLTEHLRAASVPGVEESPLLNNRGRSPRRQLPRQQATWITPGQARMPPLPQFPPQPPQNMGPSSFIPSNMMNEQQAAQVQQMHWAHQQQQMALQQQHLAAGDTTNAQINTAMQMIAQAQQLTQHPLLLGSKLLGKKKNLVPMMLWERTR